MWETCAVDLRVRLPKPLAAEIEEVQRNDPDKLSQMVLYAMTCRQVFEVLASQERLPQRRSP